MRQGPARAKAWHERNAQIPHLHEEAKIQTTAEALSLARVRLRLDVEAEHHAALVVLGDVAVRHPQTWICYVQQDVDRLPRPNEHRVLPDQVRLDDAIARQNEEATRA